jgi:TolB-like protein
VADAPIFIETLPRRGYRFVAPVQVVPALPAPPGTPPPAPPQQEADAVRPSAEPPVGPPAAPAPPRRLAARRSIGSGRALALAVVGVAACLSLVGWLAADGSAQAAGPIRSLAVLQVSNLTGDPRQDHLAHALGAMMVADLARRPEISLASHGSSRRYDGSRLSARDIGRELAVEGLFEAAVVRADSSIRVTAVLVDTRTDRLVWAETFEGDACDFLALQDLIADALVEALGLQPWTALQGDAARPAHPEAAGLTCAAEAGAAAR